jgi:uncharacterized metal-binding protein
MPSGIIHHRLWKYGWGVECAAFAVLLSHSPTISIGTAIGYFLGQFLDPDLDLVGITGAEGRILRKLPVLGAFIVGYWTVFGGLFRRHHRSFWTHSYVISTAIRFVYGFWWVVLFKHTETWLLMMLFGMFIGLCIADAIHIRADKVIGGK